MTRNPKFPNERDIKPSIGRGDRSGVVMKIVKAVRDENDQETKREKQHPI